MRRTCILMTAVIVLAAFAAPSFAQYRRVTTVNPYLVNRNYPLTTPYSMHAQAIASQYQAQQLHDQFRTTVYQMAYQNSYNPYAYSPYAYNPYAYNPYAYNPYPVPYAAPVPAYPYYPR